MEIGFTLLLLLEKVGNARLLSIFSGYFHRLHLKYLSNYYYSDEHFTLCIEPYCIRDTLVSSQVQIYYSKPEAFGAK